MCIVPSTKAVLPGTSRPPFYHILAARTMVHPQRQRRTSERSPLSTSLSFAMSKGGRQSWSGLLVAVGSLCTLSFLVLHLVAREVIETHLLEDPTSVGASVFSDGDEKECTVWIAPSSLPGFAGYGLYTTRDIEPGESILGGPNSVAIPITLPYRNHWPNHTPKRRWRAVFKRYWWERGVPDHVWYESTEDAADYQVGIGSLPNHHCLLHSLSKRYPEVPYDDSMASRFESPLTGAFSYHSGRDFTVDSTAKAGSEIFLNYGYCYRNESNPDWADNVPMIEDYSQALAMLKSRGSSGKALQFDENGQVVIPAGTSPQVAGLLPKSRRAFDEVMKGSRAKEEFAKRLARDTLNNRTPEWIRQNGICMENLAGRPSTIVGAGQGAFAQRTIRKGELVAPAPLMQIVNKTALELYDKNGARVGTQLLMNYCMGHKDSSLLLCPNTNVVLINHCSVRTKQCGSQGPNAMYRWATGWDPTSDAWRQKTIEELDEEKGRGLAFEIVALRDIRPGDEVTFDYGEEWEAAFEEHAASWKPLPAPKRPWLTAKDANDMKKIPGDFISGDSRKTVRHAYLFTGCQYVTSNEDDSRHFREEIVDWESLADDELLLRFSSSGSYYDERERSQYEKHRDKSHWPCTVISEDADGTYTVRIHQSRFHEGTLWSKNGLPRFLTGYPRKAIHFFVRPFGADQHLPGVFRHPIGIRDEIFPEQWKNM